MALVYIISSPSAIRDFGFLGRHVSEMVLSQEAFMRGHQSPGQYILICPSPSSACDDTESLSLRDEAKEVIEGSRLNHRRYTLAVKVFIALSISTILGGMVFLIVKWASSSFTDLRNCSPSTIDASISVVEAGKDRLPDLNFTSLRQSVRAFEKDSSGAKYLLKNPCGHTPDEARARGCRFGMLNFAWVPEACYDEEIEEQFKKYAEWQIWLYQNRTSLVTWDEAQRGEFEFVFVEWDRESFLPLKSVVSV
jgi:hypothetical protein